MAVFSRYSARPLSSADATRKQRGIQMLARQRIGNVEPTTDPRRRALQSLATEGVAPPDDGTSTPTGLAPTGRAQSSTPPPSTSPSLVQQAAGLEGGTMTGQVNLRRDPAAADALAKHERAVTSAATPNPFDLLRLEQEQAEDLETARRQYAQATATATADAQARGGLGGLGLSGATQALVRDTQTAGADAQARGIAALRAAQRGERRETAIDALNAADLASQGVTVPGLGGFEGTPEDVEARKREEAIAELDLNNNRGVDIAPNFGDDVGGTAPGTKEQPFVFAARDVEKIVAAYGKLRPVIHRTTWGAVFREYVDESGTRHFYFGPDGLPEGTPGIENGQTLATTGEP